MHMGTGQLVEAKRYYEAGRAERDKRYIFGGDRRVGNREYLGRPNKRGTRRRFSTFNIIVTLVGCGIAIVTYVSNTIAVNQLAFEVNQLRTKYDKIASANSALQAEISRKSSLERIGRIATEELGLTYARQQPQWFDVDAEDPEIAGTDRQEESH